MQTHQYTCACEADTDDSDTETLMIAPASLVLDPTLINKMQEKANEAREKLSHSIEAQNKIEEILENCLN